MMKNQKIRFFNSGLYYKTAFYTEYDLVNVFNNIDDDYSYREYVSYNYDLMKTRYSEAELKNLEEDEIDDLVYNDFYQDINKFNTLYSPLIFKEEIALDCGLIPFNYNFELFGNVNLLALGYIHNSPAINDSQRKSELLFKLDAYQVLTDNSIDQDSPFFSKEIALVILGDEIYNKDIARGVLGDEVYNRVIEAINNEVIW